MVEFCVLFVFAPSLILGLAAQLIVHSTLARTRMIRARTSGYAAARQMLDAAGLSPVGIEQVSGTLNDQFDARSRTLRLSADVFHGRSIAAVGIAAHEAGHAVQQKAGDLLLAIRSVAVPSAQYGSPCGLLLVLVGLAYQPLLLLGMLLYGGSVLLQIINVPGEFSASNRAEAALVDLEILDGNERELVRPVLNVAALAPVAVTLQSVVTLASALFRFLWPP